MVEAHATGPAIRFLADARAVDCSGVGRCGGLVAGGFRAELGAGSPGALQTAQVQTTIHFELHAPGADQVELLGSFNDWKTGDVVLTGSDASGHWTVDVTLPEGRYEYIFLVDGERWMADPRGSLHRPDGFGHENTVLNVYEDDNHA